MERERITMYNMSSAMGAQFAEAAAEMTERIRRLGPNPLPLASHGEGRPVTDATDVNE